MKKIIAIAVSVVMVLAASVCVFAEEELYSMTMTQGQYQESLPIPGPIVMQEAYSRIATNWVGGGSEFNAILNAINTPDSTLIITYTGTINQFIIQSENGSTDSAIDITPVEVDGKNVATIPCADIIAAMPVATSGSFGGWANVALIFDGDVTLESFRIVTGADAPAEDTADDTAPAEDITPVEDTTTAEDTTTSAPADTGIALALVPMAIAAAAVVVSKRR